MGITFSSMIARPAVAGLLVLGLVTSAPVNGQPGRGLQASHITIPFLANATRLADLSFEGGECDIDPSGNTMACQFQQVFFTTSDLAPQTCLVTTNRYERTFKRQGSGGSGRSGEAGRSGGGGRSGESATRWVSTQAPEGVCGVVEETTLQDGGSVRWTMETRKQVTRRDAAQICRDLDDQTETLSWQNIRRPLPCAFIQPGGITR
jgi:hypothetical protein